MDKFIQIAVNELGQKEITGSQDNPTIVRYAHEAGFTWVNDDETPWCSVFVNWCAKKAGLKGSGKLNARSWLTVGQAVENPEPGDIVVFWRGSLASWEGHVGIFIGFSKDGERIYSLGGNQGNQVSISAYDKKYLLGFRRLAASAMFAIPNKILKKGDKGNDVKALQDALKLSGFNCGTSDGDFGGKTEQAVILLQSTKSGLMPTGVFDAATRDHLASLLTQ